MHTKFGMENLKGRYDLENVSTDGENMKRGYKETECRCVNWVNLVQDRNQ
jgi:hypothetical protein